MTFDLPYAAPSMMDPTIFIVDDDAGVRDSLSLLLGLRGYRVQVFERAGDFLSVVRAESYGCALFDIRMQGMGGLELQHTLKARGIGLPIIFMTGYANVAAARTAFKAGAVDFLSKPLPEAELLEAIQRALRHGAVKERQPEVRASALRQV